MFLISPTGVQVELFTDVCGGGAWTLANTGFNLGDNKFSLIGSVCPPGAFKYRPEGALSAFIGQNTLGAWKLQITDDAGTDTGLLDSWGLRFGGGNCPTLTPEPASPTPTPTYTPTCAPNQIGPWVIRSPIPTAVYYNSVTSDGSYAYSVGGFGTSVVSNQFARYDPSSDVWTPLAPLPVALYGTLAVYGGNNKLIMFGGANSSLVVTNTTRIYDIPSNTWSLGAPMPGPRHVMGGGLYNGKIYIAGGATTDSLTSTLSTTWEYNISANTWLTKTSMPQALAGPGYGVIGSHLYIAGRQDIANTNRDALYDYDVNANTWATRTNLLTGVKAPGSAVFNGSLLLFGGGTPFFGPGNTLAGMSREPAAPLSLNVAQSYDPVSNSWVLERPLNVSRCCLGGTAVGPNAVAIGGFSGSSILNTVEVMLPCSLSTITPTPTFTPTNTLTPTHTATPTSTPQPLLVGHVTIQGRLPQPHPLQSVPVTLTLKSGATEYNFNSTTDQSGFFTVTVPSSGSYNWRVKNPQTLANAGSVTLSSAVTQQEMGLLLEGDADNTNCASITDFNILKVTFGRALGDPGYDARADFDGTNAVSVTDFNLIKLNFGTCGANPISPH